MTCDSQVANNNSSEENIKKKVTEWILSNADFPSSYKSISFASFEVIDFNVTGYSSKKYYRITHKYKLNSRNNKEVSNTHLFVLTENHKVSIISEEETLMLQSVPPSVFDWAINFGEKFENTDYGDLEENYYFQKFRDYKQIGGHLWKDFDYLDDECLEEFTKAINTNSKQKLTVKRVIRAIPKFSTTLDSLGLNELGMSLSKVYNNNPRHNFIVIKDNLNDSEGFWLSDFNKQKQHFNLVEIETGLVKKIPVDQSFVKSNCFIMKMQQSE